MAYPYPYQPGPSAPIAPQQPGVPPVHSAAIVGAQYVASYPVDLAVVRKVLSLSNGNFVVQDPNGSVMFKVKHHLITLHDRRVLVGSAGKPILTLRAKIITAHDRWKAYRGDSTNESNLIFSAKRSSLVQMKTKLDVFLAGNKKEDVCDYRVKGSRLERSCTIYAGESSTIVAKMHKKHSIQSVLLGKTNFALKVYPGIDYAFIVALIVILDAINKEDDDDD